MNEEDWDPVLIVLPLIVSYFVTFVTGKVEMSGYEQAWFQPPGFIFFIVWTALYIMFGFLLYESKRQEDYFTLGLVVGVVFLTYLWQFVFVLDKNYELAMFVLLLTLALGLVLFVRLYYSKVVNDTSFGEGYLMIYVPFIAWIIFAMFLSSFTKKSTKKTKRKKKN